MTGWASRRRGTGPVAPAAPAATVAAAGVVLSLLSLLSVLAPPAAAGSEAARARELFRFADRYITESSGLVDAGEVVHTVNDSGSAPELFTVDTTNGETAAVTTYSTAEVVDVEALAPAPGGEVWVGDIGDNFERRDQVSVYRVTPGATAPAPRYDLRYPDGPRDAETLLAHPRSGRLFVVSKRVFGATVYAAPRRLVEGAVNRLRPFAHVSGLLTDGAFLPGGEHVLLRGYGTATLMGFPGFAPLGTVELPAQQQGEGLSVGSDGRVLLSSEGIHEPVLEVRLPDDLAAAVAADAARHATPPAGSPSGSPSSRTTRSAPAIPDDAPTTAAAADRPWGWWAAGALGTGGAALTLLLLAQRRSR